MNSQRILGIILLVAGIVLFVTGMNSSHSAIDQISNAFTGRFTDNTVWFIAGGIITAISGAALLLIGGRGKNA